MTVLFITTRCFVLFLFNIRDNLVTTFFNWVKSIPPFDTDGVPTVRNVMSDFNTSSTFSENWMFLVLIDSLRNFDNWGSKKSDFPFLSCSNFFLLLSIAIVSKPLVAFTTANGNPTNPNPITDIFGPLISHRCMNHNEHVLSLNRSSK